jgi:pimeloyl-ACP methyl ester carboxylesterase
VIGEGTWRGALPGYDWAYDEALAGHAAVTYDQLGYGRSDTPDGMKVCVGSQADVAHQLVDDLRAATYEVAGGRPVSFQRVALAGLSLGGLIAPVEAYSFRDVDALVGMGAAFDQGIAPAFLAPLATKPDGMVLGCAGGGQPKRTGAPSGYVYYFTEPLIRSLFYNADPAVVQAVLVAEEREACGLGQSILPTIAVDHLRLATITVPVLLMFGDHDAPFPPPAGANEKALYTGSHDVTYDLLAATGHAIPGERTAPTARALLSEWLHGHGF